MRLAELFVTVVSFVALWLGMVLSLRYSYWLCLLLAVPAAGFLVRLFMIQHDCGHGSFFRRRRANDWLGRGLGVLTLTPYGYWRRTHATHHATSGHLGRRGTGDVDTLTVHEYQSLPAWRRALYRLTRHPVVVLGVAPFYLFVLKHRLPVRLMRGGWEPWFSVMSTNLAIVAVVGLLVAVLGVRDFLLVQGPITLLASSAGVWLFYVQHQFEHTYWEQDADWNVHTGALHGSSHYDLPAVLRWFTANIGIHHMHHLASRIPCYRLGEALRDPSRAAGRESPDAHGELRLPATRVVGRGPAAAGGLSRGPGVAGAGVRISRRRRSRFVIGIARAALVPELTGPSLMQISTADHRLRYPS